MATSAESRDLEVAGLNRFESLSWRSLGAGLVGNVLEWYDFGLYGFLAPLIGAHFFPSSNSLASLLGAYGGFALGFAMRPVGAAVFGHIGDRLGRRTVLILSIIMMGGATALIGLLPTYREIGIWAPILLVAVRLFQGLSVGGEFTGSVSYLIETAPSHRRGLAGSFANIGSGGGYILAAALAAVTLTLLHRHAALPWIWRMPFLAGGVLAWVAWLFIKRVSRAGYEPDRRDVHHELPLKQALKEAPRAMVLTTIFTWGYGVLSYLTLVFLPIFASRFGRIDIADALAVNSALQLAALVFIPVAGWLTDRIIRRRTLMLLVFALVSLTAIGFFDMAGRGGLLTFGVAQATLIVLLFLVEGTEPALLAELFVSRYRMAGYSLAFNVGLGIGGGTAPLIATALIGPFGKLAGAGYLMACAVLTVGALCLMTDRSREPLS